MRLGIVVEESDKYQAVGQETADNERIRKLVVAHGVIIELNYFVDWNLCIFDLTLGSLVFAVERSESKLSIVAIDDSKERSIIILDYLVSFDVLLAGTTQKFFIAKLASFEIVHFDPSLVLWLLGQSDSSRRVIGDKHRYNGKLSENRLRVDQICKYILVVFEFRVWSKSYGSSSRVLIV